MVDEIHRQLVTMHGVRFAPEPYAAAFMDWGTDPFGGGVNFWNIHARSWEVIPRIIKPVDDVPVYICGEAYSNGQGWVEGALETAELMLQTHFDLPPPEWVTTN
jgi:monoamine oxidase